MTTQEQVPTKPNRPGYEKAEFIGGNQYFDVWHPKDNSLVYILNVKTRKILDEQTIQDAGNKLFQLIDETLPNKQTLPASASLVLDFGDVEYFSTAGFGKYLTADKKLQRNGGGRLGFANVSDDISEVFEITKLNRYFPLYRDLPHAIPQPAAGQSADAPGGSTVINEVKKPQEAISI